MNILKEIEDIMSEMEADILGPRPRQIPERWSYKLGKVQLELNKIIYIYKCAISGKEFISNQGQALDGYSELANYRDVIRGWIDEG